MDDVYSGDEGSLISARDYYCPEVGHEDHPVDTYDDDKGEPKRGRIDSARSKNPAVAVDVVVSSQYLYSLRNV